MMLLRKLILLVLVTVSYCDWSLPSLVHPGKKERRVVPHHDYTEISDLERFLNQLEIFPSFSKLTSYFPMDIREGSNEIEVQMDMPGVDKKDIDIAIHNHNEVVISAHKEAIHRDEGDNIKRMERYSGNVTRTIILPDYVDPDSMNAEYVNGVLYIKVPKIAKEEEETCAKKVTIK